MLDSVTDGLESVSLIAFLAIAAVVIWGAVWLFLLAVQYLKATPLQRVRMRHAWRVARQWRRLAPNIGLARIDEMSKGRKDLNGKTVKPTIHVPRLKAFPEPWGIRVRATTIPKVGIEEYEKATGWLADAWGCETVEVERVAAGLVELRGLVGNPLDEHRPYAFPTDGEWSLPIGHNPWMRHIGIPLRELSGIKLAGMPGYGKSQLMLGWFASMAPRGTVQFGLFDGKTSDPRYGDWGEFGDRAMFIVGDNPETAHQRLTEVVCLIKDRPAALVQERGTHKFWKHGPTESIPLVLIVMDECHNYIDAAGLKGKEKELIEANQRLMRTIAKEGRGTGVIPIVGTQKQTTDAIPSGVRDQLEVGICFAVTTLDGAEAALGSAIRKDEPNQPTKLRDKERFVGVCVVTGVPGLAAEYDRIRVGEVDDVQLGQLVGETVNLRQDIVPAAAAPVRDASAGTGAIPLQKDLNARRKKAS
jgi:S-DNA-T family DNA segregation ATPase FtsK/SpoIIIE